MAIMDKRRHQKNRLDQRVPKFAVCLGYLCENKFGLGVYASKQIGKNEIIERSPALTTKLDEESSLHEYSYCNNVAGSEEELIGLGYTSMYNHSLNHPNAEFSIVMFKTKGGEFRAAIEVKAIRDIAKDEEIFIDYGYNFEVG